MAMTWNDKALDRLKEQVEGTEFVITVWTLIDDLKQLNKENEEMRQALADIANAAMKARIAQGTEE